MKNFVQTGDILTLTAPYDLTSGTPFMSGNVFGVASYDALSGTSVEAAMEGVFDLPKVSAQAWAEGDVIYWDATAKLCTNVATNNTAIGWATQAAANPTATGRVQVDQAPTPANNNGLVVLQPVVSIANGDSGYVVSPVAGKITRIDGALLGGAVATADAAVAAKIGAAGAGAAVTNGAMTFPVAASAVGETHNAAPTAANVVAVGSLIYFTVTGGPTGGRTAQMSITIQR